MILYGTYCSGQMSQYTRILVSEEPLHNVSLIKTSNDFNQNNLTKTQIDNKIASLIKNSKSKSNFLLDIPFNSKKLMYVGKKHPKEYLEFSNDAFSSRLTHIDEEYEIYVYDGIHILIPSKSNRDLLNLFFTLRALTIIKVKYPEAYEKLIQQNYNKNSASYTLHTLHRRPPAINKNNSIICFNNSPEYIASNSSDLFFGDKITKIGGWNYTENTHNLVVSIDNETIVGDNEYRGSKALYRLPNENQNYFYYLRDGLIESIIHEFTHLYITNSTAIDEKAFFINEMRNDTNDTDFDFDVEEAIVLNTILKYYKKKEGISNSVIRYYENILLNKRKKLINTYRYSDKINLQRYYALKCLSKKGSSNFEDVYSLSILDD